MIIFHFCSRQLSYYFENHKNAEKNWVMHQRSNFQCVWEIKEFEDTSTTNTKEFEGVDLHALLANGKLVRMHRGGFAFQLNVFKQKLN